MAEWILKRAVIYLLPKVVDWIIDCLGERLSKNTKEKIKKQEPLSDEEVMEIRTEINRTSGMVV